MDKTKEKIREIDRKMSEFEPLKEKRMEDTGFSRELRFFGEEDIKSAVNGLLTEIQNRAKREFESPNGSRAKGVAFNKAYVIIKRWFPDIFYEKRINEKETGNYDCKEGRVSG